jgi:hypothetical protein
MLDCIRQALCVLTAAISVGNAWLCRPIPRHRKMASGHEE